MLKVLLITQVAACAPARLTNPSGVRICQSSTGPNDVIFHSSSLGYEEGKKQLADYMVNCI